MPVIQPWEGAMARFVSAFCSNALCLAAIYLVIAAPARALQLGGGGGSLTSSTLMISGNVYYDNHQPAEHVTVELRNAEGELEAPQATTGTGGFEFRRLARGTYGISVDVQGYEPASITVDVTYASAKGLQVFLRPVHGPATAKTVSVSAHELSMPQRARDLVDSGKKKLYQQRDAQGGLGDFQQAVSEAPDYYEADYQIAMADLALGKRDDAEKNFHKSIEVSSDKYGEADVGLGTMFLDRGEFSGGEKLVRRGIELNPSYWLGYYELGRAQLKGNHLADAQKSGEQARALAPGAAVVYRLLSNVHLQEKDYPSLLQDIDAYIKLDPESPAGMRAKQMREDVEKKISAQKSENLRP
jgi:tetratricopeptide (TPR) repeat protein